MKLGGSKTGTSGFPHQFFGMAGSDFLPRDVSDEDELEARDVDEELETRDTRINFIGADARCNKDGDKTFPMYEYPAYADGKKSYPKDVPKGGKRETDTPVRVIYHDNGKTGKDQVQILCGVITHITVSDTGSGSGPFRGCDL